MGDRRIKKFCGAVKTVLGSIGVKRTTQRSCLAIQDLMYMKKSEEDRHKITRAYFPFEHSDISHWKRHLSKYRKPLPCKTTSNKQHISGCVSF